MGLRDHAGRKRTAEDAFVADRLLARFRDVEATKVAEMPCRKPVAVAGEVKRIRVAPRSGVPSLEVVLSDGTGDVIAVFTGRRAIPGIEHGRAMTIEGVARDERGRRVMLNPIYTLLPIKI